MNVQRAHSSGVAGLILALDPGIIEWVSVARCQHAGSAIKIGEIGALQGSRGARARESRQNGHEDNKNEGLGS